MTDIPERPRFGERAAYGPGDVCYRHPDRPTFTLCQRCGNNICPDCQSNSAVGVLCPSCVKAAVPSIAQRSSRGFTVTSRKIADRSNTVVTYTLMIACVIVFAAQMFIPGVTQMLWYAPVYSHPELFEPWRMLTAMFTHSTSNFFHIAFNMYALWLFGRQLERVIGRGNFIALYVLSGLGGSLAVMLWGYTSIEAFRTPTVGASGAIFGVLGATLVALKIANANARSLALLIGINFAIGFLPGTNISWQAHLGGFLIGALTMWVIARLRGPRKKCARLLALSSIAVGCVLLAAAYAVIDPVLVLT